MADGGGLHISIGLDNRDLIQKAEESVQAISRIGKSGDTAVQSLSQSLNKSGHSALGFGQAMESGMSRADAVFASVLNNGDRVVDITSMLGVTFKEVGETARVMSNDIDIQQKIIKKLSSEYDKLVGSRKKAHASGDKKKVEALTTSMQSLKVQIDKERSALNGMQRAMSQATAKMSEMQKAGEASKKELQGLENPLKKIGGLVGVTFGVATVSHFSQKLAKTRGEFQQFEISFESMLGSKVKADKLMSQLVETSTKTPYQLQELAGGAKRLISYGEEAEKINETLLKLGDIASGTGTRLSDLVYLYGTSVVQGRLFSRDINQFANRGIDLISELAKQFGVTKDKVRDLVTAGKVGTEEFKKAIDSLANGRFQNLMEKQTKSITGQLSNLEDKVSVMFNEIGKDTEGVISGSISSVAYLIEHYEELGRVLAVLVATYGTFKTAMIVNNAIMGVQSAGSVMSFVKSLRLARKAQVAFNLACKTNPYVRLATILVALGSAIWALKDRTDEATKAQERFNKAQEEANKQVQERKSRAEALIATIRDEAQTTHERYKAFKELQSLYPKYFANLTQEQIQTMKLIDLKKLLNNSAEYDKVAKNKGRIQGLKGDLEKLEQEQQYFLERAFDDKAKERVRGRFKGQFEVLRNEIKKLTSENYQIEFSWKSDEEKRAIYKAEIEDIQGKLEQAQSKVKTLKSTLLDTRNIIGGKWQLNLDTQEAENEVKRWSFLLDKVKQDYKAVGGTDADNKAKPKQDKAYWTSLRDEYQGKIDGLDAQDIKAQTQEYKKLIKLRDDAQKQLDLYGTKSKTNKVYDPSKDKKAIKRYTEALIEAHYQSELELEQAKELANAKGYEREQLLIKQNYERQLADIKRYETQLLEQRIEAERHKYKLSHNGEDKGFNAEGIQLSTEQTNILDNKRALAEQTLQQSKVKLFEDYLTQVENFEQKRTEVAQKYGDIRKAIAENEKLSQEQRTEALARAKASEQEALNKVQEEALSKYNLLDLSKGGGSDLIEQSIKKFLPLFHDLSKLSFKELKKAKTAIQGIKIDSKTLKELEKAGVDIEELNKQLEELKNTATGQVQTELFKNLIKDVDVFGNALQNIGGQLSDLGGSLGETGDTISKIGGIASSGAGLAGSIMSGDVLGAITNGVQTAIQVGEFFQDSNEEEIRKTNERLIEANKNLDRRMGELGNTISQGYGASAIKASEEAIRLQKLKEDNLKREASNLMGMHGKHHSNNYYWGEHYGKSMFSVLQQVLGRQMNSIMDVTAEEWRKIIEETPDLWGAIKDVGYYKEAYDKIEEYANQVGEVEKLNDKLVNAITGISFEGLRDDFVEQLMDMEASTEDFGKNINKIIQKAMTKFFVDKELNGKLKAWKEKLDKTLTQKGDHLTEADVSKLREEYLEYVEQARKRSTQFAKITGYGEDPEREGSRGRGIATASQESVDELNGRATAIQSHTYSISDMTRLLVANTNNILRSVLRIEENTECLHTMNDNLKDVKDSVDDIKLKGIDIKN